VLFKFHKKHIEVYSGAFAGADQFASSPTELVELTETSEVLEALLGLMSLQRRPDLTDLPFEVMAPLAEAVEKYQVFSAMPICEMSMRCVCAIIHGCQATAMLSIVELRFRSTLSRYWSTLYDTIT
jgi:hypothetical protein